MVKKKNHSVIHNNISRVHTHTLTPHAHTRRYAPVHTPTQLHTHSPSLKPQTHPNTVAHARHTHAPVTHTSHTLTQRRRSHFTRVHAHELTGSPICFPPPPPHLPPIPGAHTHTLGRAEGAGAPRSSATPPPQPGSGRPLGQEGARPEGRARGLSHGRQGTGRERGGQGGAGWGPPCRPSRAPAPTRGRQSAAARDGGPAPQLQSAATPPGPHGRRQAPRLPCSAGPHVAAALRSLRRRHRCAPGPPAAASPRRRGAPARPMAARGGGRAGLDPRPARFVRGQKVPRRGDRRNTYERPALLATAPAPKSPPTDPLCGLQ